MLQLDSQSIQSMAQKWQEGLSAITGAFNSQLRGLLAGTTSFHQAFKSMVGDLIITFIQACEQMGVKWLALQLGMTTASTTGASERAAAEAAGQGTSIASSVATALSKIQAGVASTIAGVTGATALTLGPAAPAAGAAAGAETEAAALAVLAPFEVGAYEIPRITPALLHRGEMVLPASFASGLRSAISGGSTGAGVDTHNHFHFPGVMDTNGFMQAIRNNSSPIARMLSKAMTQNPSLRPAY
jgi:hypothetical protein